MTDLMVPDVDTAPSTSLARLQPQSLKQLAWFANQAANSGLFKVGNRNLTGDEAFLLMSQGVELGLSPLQSLRELNIINGRVDVPASVRAARISASPKTRVWEAIGDNTQCTIRAKRVDRENGCTVVVKLENLPKAWAEKHKEHLEDALYARAVRRISRQYFPDLNLGIETAEWERDPEKVIDIAEVERRVDPEGDGYFGMHKGCMSVPQGRLFLQANANGGAFLRCNACGETEPPPQAVRDEIRGTPEALTLAAGERAMSDDEAQEWIQGLAPEPATMPVSDEVLADNPPREEVMPDTRVPADVNTEPPAEVPVDAAAKAGGSLSYAERFRIGARAAILEHIATARTLQGQAKTAVRDALLEQGWSGLPGDLQGFVDYASDETLSALLDTFAIKVNIAKENA